MIWIICVSYNYYINQMPGFRGGVFASCVLYLFRLRLPLPYLSIGLLFTVSVALAVSCPSLSTFAVSIPTPFPLRIWRVHCARWLP